MASLANGMPVLRSTRPLGLAAQSPKASPRDPLSPSQVAASPKTVPRTVAATVAVTPSSTTPTNTAKKDKEKEKEREREREREREKEREREAGEKEKEKAGILYVLVCSQWWPFFFIETWC